jgi:hypothetical protein
MIHAVESYSRGNIISGSLMFLRNVGTILIIATFLWNPIHAQISELERSFLYVRPAKAEPFWSIGTYERNWRIYSNRIVLVELVDEPSTFRATWFKPEHPAISIIVTELPQQEPVRFYSSEYDSGYIDIYSTEHASIVRGGESIGRLMYDNASGTLEIVSDAPILLFSSSRDGGVQSVIKTKSRHDGIKSTETVQTYKPPVMFSHPLVALATYTERNPDAYFDKHGNILLTTVAPFWGSIPLTDSLFDPDIGQKTYRTTKINIDGDVIWSVYAGPGARYSVHAISNNSEIYKGYGTVSDLYKTEGRYQPESRGGVDGAVSCWSGDGRCLWGTYIGGARDEYVTNIALDSQGNIYLVIETTSDDIPIKNAIIESKPNPSHIYDVALISLTPDGRELRWATYLSGVADVNMSDTTIPVGRSFARCLKVDREDNVYVAYEQDGLLSVPTTEGAYSRTIKSGAEVVLMKFDRNGELHWSTLVNSTASDEVFDMNFDKSNNVVLRTSQRLYSSATPPEQLAAIGVAGETLTRKDYLAFVFKFDTQGRALQVWAPFENDFVERDVSSTYVSGSQLVSICHGIHRATPDAIYCTPNASVEPPDRVKIVLARTDDFIEYDTLFASPALGSYPTQLDVFNDKILVLDQSNTLSSGACLTDTTWSSGTDAVRTLGYLMVLQRVVSSVPLEPKRAAEHGIKWSVFPTPASDVLSIRIDGTHSEIERPISGTYEFSVISIAGETIDTGVMEVVDDVSTISVEHLSAGCYLLHITTSEIVVASLTLLVN